MSLWDDGPDLRWMGLPEHASGMVRSASATKGHSVMQS